LLDELEELLEELELPGDGMVGELLDDKLGGSPDEELLLDDELDKLELLEGELEEELLNDELELLLDELDGLLDELLGELELLDEELDEELLLGDELDGV